jgi:nitrite reductase/ring-hydroxylating ferredoxin subunit
MSQVRALLEELPAYRICTVGELLNVLDTDLTAANERGRRILKIPLPPDAPSNARPREIVVAVHPRTAEVFAFDRYCYHIGYPLDLGDIEDVVPCAPMPPPPPVRAAATVRQQARPITDSAVDAKRAPIALEASAVRAARLDADLDDDLAAEELKSHACITCPLHNRIFDMRNGELLTRRVVDATGEAPRTAAAAEDTSDKTVVCQSSGERQRVHPVTLEPAADPADRMIVVHDTFGFSNPAPRHVRPAVDGEEGAVRKTATVSARPMQFFRGKTIESDRQNC